MRRAVPSGEAFRPSPRVGYRGAGCGPRRAVPSWLRLWSLRTLRTPLLPPLRPLPLLLILLLPRLPLLLLPPLLPPLLPLRPDSAVMEGRRAT